MIETVAFQRFVAAKTQEATNATIERLSTTFDRREDAGLQGIGNAWSRLHYGSEFGLVRASRSRTAVSLVFIQTQNGNTGGPNPSAFGGGATDQHLNYEGLSRVAANAVLAGAGSVHRNAFFSVWHPELIALRASLGLRRHPARIVVSKLLAMRAFAVWLLLITAEVVHGIVRTLVLTPVVVDFRRRTSEGHVAWHSRGGDAMFVGHFGMALAAKRLAPRASLAVLILAAQLADVMWPVLVALGTSRSASIPAIRPSRRSISWRTRTPTRCSS